MRLPFPLTLIVDPVEVNVRAPVVAIFQTVPDVPVILSVAFVSVSVRVPDVLTKNPVVKSLH